MQYSYLQTNILPTSVWYLIGAAAILVLVVFYLRKTLARRKEGKETRRDSRLYIVNDSNYNVNHVGIDGHRTEDLTPEEAAEVVGNLKESGTIPSRDEFFALRKAMKKN